MFVINCKNYKEIQGEKIIKLARTVEKISKKYKVKIMIVPPYHLVKLLKNTTVPILSQYVTDSEISRTAGFIVPELLKKSGIAGSLVNHDEHRISENKIKNIVIKLKKLNLISIVCVRDVSEAKKYVKLNPNYIAIEPPELIGTGRSISKERPELITKTVSILKNTKNDTKLLCGAGIDSGGDVAKILELGSSGVLVASAILKSRNWNETITEFARSMNGKV